MIYFIERYYSGKAINRLFNFDHMINEAWYREENDKLGWSICLIKDKYVDGRFGKNFISL